MVKEDGGRRPDIALDINGAIEELHKYSPLEMKKILQDAHSLNFRVTSTTRGALVSVDAEKLATFLPLHLLACVASSISQPRFRYLLRGVRLLHSLSILAPRYPRLEQILLQEVKIREQIIDLVIFMLIILADIEQDGRWGSFLAVLHSSLVACSLYLLTAFVTPEWRDVAPVLLAHPKIDIFMDAAFDSVRRDIGLLQARFKALSAKLSKEKTPPLCGAEQISSTTLEHCEASLQILQALSESQAFRDRLLNHKELCKNGGILSLVLVVLQLQLPSHLQHIQSLSASISRLKSKILAMLLKFCETETVSFLDEVASDPKSMNLAKIVAGEIILLVEGAFFEPFTVQMVHEEIEKCPAGMLYLNAMRLADVLSDDSNFRNFFMDRIAPDLATILAMDPTEFISKWCGGCSAQDMADCEIDATLVYDPFHGSGAAMLSSPGTSEENNSGCSLSIKTIEPTFYAQELSALLVKIFANLHCFNPEVCPADEKDRFLSLFMRCLSAGPLSPLSSSFFMTSDQTAVRVCENLHVLVDHVALLPADLANDEDVQLASVFAAELHEAFCLSPDVHAEAPVVSYVRDAHEQRLGGIVARRVSSERWQRLQREMEQNIPECDPETLPAQQEETTALVVAEEASSAVDSKADVNQDEKNDIDVKPQEEEEMPLLLPLPPPPATTEDESVSPGENDAKEIPAIPELNEDAVKTVTERIEPEQEQQEEQVAAIPDNDIQVDTNNATSIPIISPVISPVIIEPAPTTVAAPPTGLQKITVERPPRPPEAEPPRPERERAHLIRKPEDEPRIEHPQVEQPRKRQRRIMSERQIAMMESALRDEPEMQRYSYRVQYWTEKLNEIGPELNCGQLKNWINNRKAKLAKLAKEGRLDPVTAAAINRPKPFFNPFDEQQAVDHSRAPYNSVVINRPDPPPLARPPPVVEPSVTQIGQTVALKDELGRDIAYGITKAVTPGEEGAVSMCLVEIMELKVDRHTRLPIGSDFMGTTFDEAEQKLGKLIVAWPSNNVQLRI